jgi:hypothetical protein
MAPAARALQPQAKAHLEIARQLDAAGWTLRPRDEMNLAAADAIVLRNVLHRPPRLSYVSTGQSFYRIPAGVILPLICLAWVLEDAIGGTAL